MKKAFWIANFVLVSFVLIGCANPVSQPKILMQFDKEHMDLAGFDIDQKLVTFYTNGTGVLETDDENYKFTYKGDKISGTVEAHNVGIVIMGIKIDTITGTYKVIGNKIYGSLNW